MHWGCLCAECTSTATRHAEGADQRCESQVRGEGKGQTHGGSQFRRSEITLTPPLPTDPMTYGYASWWPVRMRNKRTSAGSAAWWRWRTNGEWGMGNEQIPRRCETHDEAGMAWVVGWSFPSTTLRCSAPFEEG